MTSWNHYSNHVTEEVVGVAAAAYVITSMAEPSSKGHKPSLIKDKSRKEDATFSTSKPGAGSEQFTGEGSKKVSERADIKVPVINVKDERATTRVPSFKRSPSFGDHMGSSSRTRPGSSQKPGTPARRPEPPPVIEAKRQSAVRPESEQEQADAWEKAEMAKIKERYLKLDGTILAWEEKKKKKARSKLEKAEKGESEKKRARALTKFRNEMDYIKQVADGARAEAQARQRNDELKTKEKANIIRTTGELPVTCSCCQI